MKKPSKVPILSAVVTLLAIALPGPADGQTAVRSKAAASAPQYDVAREVTIEGTVARVITRPAAGMLAGAHALVTTPSETVDAHLGNYAMRGANALELSVGDPVRMLGVMATVKGRSVLLVRTVQTARGLYTVRNARGFLLRPASAAATSPHRDAKGGQS